MMIKFGTRCHILDLPSDVFPVDIGVNFIETEAGSFVLGQRDQTISANTLISEGLIEVSTLHDRALIPRSHDAPDTDE